MILVDANLLVYAHASSLPQHAAARSWLAAQLTGGARIAIAWPTLLAFVRLVSNTRVFERPEPIPAAWNQVEAWLGCKGVWVPSPTEQHAGVLAPLLQMSGLRSNDVPDAHLAALALEHGLTLCTTDAGFARFPGLRWVDPLAA